MSAQVNCPNCGTMGSPGGYCQSCGTAMPQPERHTVLSRFGILPGHTRAGRENAELTGKTRKAAHILLAVSILQSVFALVVGLAFLDKQWKWGDVGPLILVQAATAAMFYGLFFWARVSPLPATIVGLVLYCTILVIGAVMNIAAGAKSGGFGGTGVGFLDIIFIATLAGGVAAAAKQRRLLRSGWVT